VHPREGCYAFRPTRLYGYRVAAGWSAGVGSGPGVDGAAAEAAHAVPGAEQAQADPLGLAVQRDGGGGDELHLPVEPPGHLERRPVVEGHEQVVAGLVVGPPRGAGPAVAPRAHVAADDQALVELQVG